MDEFNSLIQHLDLSGFWSEQEGITLFEGFDVDELHIDPGAWGWKDGGLQRLAEDPRWAHQPIMFFRGAAMFDNLDDAKNDYLMNPEMEVFEEDLVSEDSAHVPFGMIIPTWAKGDHQLIAVTICIWWQPLN